MYYLEGSQEVLRNCAVLSHSYLDGTGSVTQQSLRTAYLKLLVSLAPDGAYAEYLRGRLSTDPVDGPPVTRYTDTAPSTDALAEVFGHADANRPASPGWQLEKCRAGADFIAERDPELASLMQLLTHTVFTMSAAWTGSMSERNAIGATLIVPDERWHINDVAEAYVHEFTHTALFLDERAKGHFQAGADQVLLRSAIRKDERTLPAVVHSLLVATEVLTWRHRHGLQDGLEYRLHGSTQSMLDRATESYDALTALPTWQESIVKDRMFQLVENAGKRLAAL
ncbi:aKG-HExxH-type peptide beta-hydroxylase [Streptomyces sp. Da 82-17]|uniref:aKG-HExxH-type peptide beta-hydroxylase n=1 Tax=Streptomyces sp. Da 82-17 TaxID=3377116 RepID=UPI0038D3E495